MVANRDRKSSGSRRKKNPKVAQTTGTLDAFYPRSGISGPTSRRSSASPYLMNDGPKPLTWDAQLLSYWFSRNPAVFQDKIVNLINNLWGGHCFVSSTTRRKRAGKITTFKLGHPVFDGVIRWCMYPQCFCQNGVNFLRRLALQEKELDDSSRLGVVEIASIAWHASFQPL